MSAKPWEKWTAEQLRRAAFKVYLKEEFEAAAMLEDFSGLKEAEQEESKRDPVTDPRPGDRIEIGKNTCVWMATGMVDFNAESKDDFAEWAEHPGATIIRRRESP